MARRVLSIQSHVTYGYVGGKAAVFPLQCLSYDVDAVNTVDFSNHSGYGRFGGSRATSQDLQTIFDTMEANGLLNQVRMVTGYIPGAEALSVVARLAKKLKARNPNMVYLLDPVLGDSGKLYVSPDVIPIYRDLLPQATIITPNWFEAETLTDIPLKDMPSLGQALKVLHGKYHIPHVVMSSIPLHDFLRNALPAHLAPQEEEIPGIDFSSFLICISSSYDVTGNGSVSNNYPNHFDHHAAPFSRVHAHVLPCIPGYFSGVGDLFSALVLGHFQSTSETTQRLPNSSASLHTSLSVAVSYALSKTFEILKFTHKQASANQSVTEDATDEERDLLDPERRVRRMRARELRLIQGQDILRAVPKAISHKGDNGGVGLREMRPWPDFWKQVSL